MREHRCKCLIPRLVLVSVFTLCVVGHTVAWGQGNEQQKAKAVAKKVEKKAERSERAEGKDDLVDDRVKVKTGADGKPVIEQKGEASFYGKDFHGKKTASGEKFNQNEDTAAHPTLPLGSKAKVTNLENGKSVNVKINDRGPYAKGRDIDLSKKAAKDIGLDKEGAAPVKIEAKIPSTKAGKQIDKKSKGLPPR